MKIIPTHILKITPYDLLVSNACYSMKISTMVMEVQENYMKIRVFFTILLIKTVFVVIIEPTHISVFEIP